MDQALQKHSLENSEKYIVKLEISWTAAVENPEFAGDHSANSTSFSYVLANSALYYKKLKGKNYWSRLGP
jgi:hypothetical protein